MRSSKQTIPHYGPAEVRGKYARPAGNIVKLLNDASEVAAKDNPMLSRPVTAGSLVAKGRVDTGVQASSQPASRPGTEAKPHNRSSMNGLMDRNRPATAERKRTRTQLTRPHELPSRPQVSKEKAPELLPRLPAEVSSDLQLVGPVKEGKDGELLDMNEERTEETPVEEAELERPVTATTWKTTSSQRRYIDELERLLKEERMVWTK